MWRTIFLKQPPTQTLHSLTGQRNLRNDALVVTLIGYQHTHRTAG